MELYYTLKIVNITFTISKLFFMSLSIHYSKKLIFSFSQIFNKDYKLYFEILFFVYFPTFSRFFCKENIFKIIY